MMRPRLRMLRVLGTTLSALLCLHASSARAQCTKDTDCKGDRVCQKGDCVDPPQLPRPAGIAEPGPGPGAPAGSAAWGDAAAPTVPAVPPSQGLPPALVCQPTAVNPVPVAGYGVPGAGPAAGSPSVGPNEYGGAFFRLSGGLGYLRTDFKHDQSGMWTDSSFAGNFSGTAVTLGADFGGPVSSHLVVFGELVGSFLHDPTAATTGHPGLDSKTWGGTYGLVSFGPAVAYYFEQSYVYITGALTITRLFGKEIDGKWGTGANLGLGKEWRASTNLGIGILVGLQAASADDTYRGSATTFVPSLRLSALWY